MVESSSVETMVIFIIIILFAVLVIIFLQNIGITSRLFGSINVLGSAVTAILELLGIKQGI